MSVSDKIEAHWHNGKENDLENAANGLENGILDENYVKKGQLSGDKASEETRRDLGEIIVYLRQLADSNVSNTALLQHVDSTVVQTQVELDGLAARSSNNNKHLQSLLLSTQDVKKLQSLIQLLSERLNEDNGSKSMRNAGCDPTIEQELQMFREKHGTLERLSLEIMSKETQLKLVEQALAHSTARLEDRKNEFESLRKSHLELDDRINHDLIQKWQDIQANTAFSRELLKEQGGPVPLSKMNRITSMLRSKSGVHEGRRVMSLNIADTFRPSTPPPNNSDDEIDKESDPPVDMNQQ
ncbi:LAMI_0H02828g1_1 [Lachancea mirantina]|uniref:LAMI_0H02828g1_1 n=1 Tax=Lachancea mirantina TaxID=1230905 RepID=A0A1G4KE94_9SACH|nr:LAMI_0H02828g1_1 [Lachancea mirantina]